MKSHDLKIAIDNHRTPIKIKKSEINTNEDIPHGIPYDL